MTTLPTPYTKTAEYLLGLVEDRLNEANRPVGVSYVAPGQEVVWDNCCEGGGQLVIRLISVTPRAQPGQKLRGPNPNCMVTSVIARFGISIIRCISTVDDRGRSPRPTVINAEGRKAVDDAWLIMQTILCDVDNAKARVTLGEYIGLGPEGGCGGGEWSVDVDVLL